MKNVIRLFGIIAFTAIIVFTMTAASCGKGGSGSSSGGSTSNSRNSGGGDGLQGTWKCETSIGGRSENPGGVVTFIFSGNTAEYTFYNSYGELDTHFKGTYTYSASSTKVIFNPTHGENIGKDEWIDYIALGIDMKQELTFSDDTLKWANMILTKQ